MGNQIEIPKEWHSHDDWDSHRPMLYAVLRNLEMGGNITQGAGGNLTEFGCGFGSTPLLADFMNEFERDFEFYESNPEWYHEVQRFLHNKGLFPDGSFVKDYMSIESVESFLFVDCAPGEIRRDIIKKFSHQCACIVAHDTEPGAEYVYQMGEVLNSFKYRLDYKPEGKPWTTVVSNFIDVSNWSLPNV